MATVTLNGKTVTLSGDLPAVGSQAPDFHLTRGDLVDVSLATYAGKKLLLDIVASLDTATCAASARRFNEAMSNRDDMLTLVISADLPFAQSRFCSVEGLEDVIPLSMMRGKSFAKDYGLLQVDGPLAGLLARAIVIIDEKGIITYTQLVPEISHEPDYDAALKALG